MGFNDKDTRLQVGINATWGGSKRPQINSNLRFQTDGLGVEFEYQHNPNNTEKPPTTIRGLNKGKTAYIEATEGGDCKKWKSQGDTLLPDGVTPSRNPNLFKEPVACDAP